MPAAIIDGKHLAAQIRDKLAQEVVDLVARGVAPGLAVVLIGQNPASQVYVRNKRAACEKAGIASFSHDLPESASEDELLSLIELLNRNPAIHGILVQLPLPGHIDEKRVIRAIAPEKDVDGFHPYNVGLLSIGEPCLAPCTPSGIMSLIDSTGVNIAGARATVIGRSNIVGKPVALMLLARSATVTICHSKTRDIAEEIRRSDIVVAAVGRPAFVKGEWIKPGAVVIDVGINRLPSGRLAGDVEFEEAAKRAAAITPVPGGVGPMTIAMLLKNTVEAAKKLCDRAIVKNERTNAR
ncbi:MAG: bifunctional methylenetetrahydrofolate dehydrogenase/methenyltetrahydrofolate cyclohydrolase FolD [bacterium]